jgi:hypothetical protein
LVIDINIIVAQISTSSDGFTVYSNGHLDETLYNQGSIYNASPNFLTVALINGNSDVENTSVGLIYGTFGGVIEGGNGIDIVHNAGVITGTSDPVVHGSTGIEISGTPTSVSLTNSGYVYGTTKGIWLTTTSVGGSIDNSGTIATDASYGTAIYVDTGPTLVTDIINRPGAVIGVAGCTAIFAASGMFHVTNQGLINGIITHGNLLNDVVDNSGTIAGSVFLVGSITNSGRITGRVVLGGNSSYNGSPSGTVGGIDVGGGSASIKGGSHADQFIFDAALAGQITKIFNFTPSQHDKIVLSEADFFHIGAHGTLGAGFFSNGGATTANQHIVYVRSTGFLDYDSNGKAAGGLHHFATLTSHPVLTHADFLVTA